MKSYWKSNQAHGAYYSQGDALWLWKLLHNWNYVSARIISQQIYLIRASSQNELLFLAQSMCKLDDLHSILLGYCFWNSIHLLCRSYRRVWYHCSQDSTRLDFDLWIKSQWYSLLHLSWCDSLRGLSISKKNYLLTP